MPADVDWPPRVRQWWARVWSSPVAAAWDPVVDLETVRRLADIYAALDSGEGTASLHAQAARAESELLLSPAARARSHVRLAGTNDDVPKRRDPAATVVAMMPDEDPRHLLAGSGS